MAQDDFIGVDGTPLLTHDANWTAADGSSIANLVLQSDMLECPAFGSRYVYYDGSTEGASELVVKANGHAGTKTGPAVDMSATNKGYAATFLTLSGANWTRVELTKDGAFLANVTGLTIPNNVDHTIRIVRVDNGADRDIEVFVDDVTTLTRNDAASPLTLAFDGMYLANGSAAVDSYVDSWKSTFSSGPTITGPDTATEGAATVATGTDLDTVTTFSLISGSYSIAQTIDSSTATTLNYVAESGVNDCIPGTPVLGVPLEPTISAAGITPYVVQQEVDDGVNPPATRNITLNGEATHEVIQTMIGVANTTPGESIFGTNIVDVENNHQAYPPKVVDTVTFTWADDGTFTTDKDQTVTFDLPMYSPSTENWSCISLTVKDTSIVSASDSEKKRKNRRQSQVYQYYLNNNWKNRFQG